MSNILRRVIHSNLAPKAIGPYSQAVLAKDTLYISGQLGLDPEKGELVSGVEEQTRQALQNMGEILKAANSSFSNVVKTTILLIDMKHFAQVNSVYSEFFKESAPARACYQVAGLPKNGLVEIEAIALVGDVMQG